MSPSLEQGAKDPTPMTFRVYLRWPNQRVSDKTATESRAVADLAFRELEAKADLLTSQGALGISYTENGKNIAYKALAGSGGGTPDPTNG